MEAQASPDEIFLPPGELLAAFKQYPGLVTNTYKLTDSCKVGIDLMGDRNKRVFGGNAEYDRKLLEKLATDGFSSRYSTKNKTARERPVKCLCENSGHLFSCCQGFTLQAMEICAFVTE